MCLDPSSNLGPAINFSPICVSVVNWEGYDSRLDIELRNIEDTDMLNLVECNAD